MKNAIKVLCFVLAIILICVGAIYFAFIWQKGDFEIQDGVNKGTAIITSYIGNSKNIEIPNRVRGKKIVSIGDSAFSGSDIESVKLSKYITSVDEYAFSECKNLKSVDLANTKSIGEAAFNECTSLEKLVIPSTVEKIGSMPFMSDDKLSVQLDESEYFVIEDGVLYTADKKELITVLPDADLKEYTCSSELEKIDEFAFVNQKNLTKFVFNDKIKQINNGLFINCSSLKELNIPANVTEIKTLFLRGTGITEITIPATVTKIEREAFNNNDVSVKIKLYSNSVAENFAKQYELNYEVIK